MGQEYILGFPSENRFFPFSVLSHIFDFLSGQVPEYVRNYILHSCKEMFFNVFGSTYMALRAEAVDLEHSMSNWFHYFSLTF